MTSLIRQETLWIGKIGDECVRKNQHNHDWALGFWADICQTCAPRTVLEVGCGPGRQIQDWWHLGVRAIGVDLNHSAAKQSGGVQALGRALPFRDATFDLVYTMGMLIHVPHPVLLETMREIVRVSRDWVLSVELDGPENSHGMYDEPDLFFAAPYTTLYQRYLGCSLIRSWEPSDQYIGLLASLFRIP